MRLVNFGAGEISDRLTILSLKLLFGAAAGKDISHFANERAALLTQIRARTLNGRWFDAYTELAAVNAALWHIEDDLRVLRGREAQDHTSETFYQDAAKVAFRIQELNDQRAVLVERINKDSGEASGSDKVFRETVRETPKEELS